ncbi:hypothetical protein BBJ28_00024837 [Nothophytophthora sp. Chile5]|nr:hypothetical protein BBJ28_00024837 [Nothophytophthora sp. Chile5]
MAIKITSKWELRRLCRAVNANALVRLGAPTPDEMGFCDSVSVKEIGGRKVTIFQQDQEDAKIATIVLRASTDNVLNDIERAIDDGVNCVKAVCRDGRFVAGAGATETIKVGKTFPTTTGLNVHMTRVHPNGQRKVQSSEKQLRARTCSKCGKVFASPFGLRVHMTRLVPCDQEHTRKDGQQPTRSGKKKVNVKTCHKCGKMMATTHSLRMHLTRVIPCDQVKLEPHNEEKRKAKAKTNARKAYYKARGRLHEIGQRTASHSIEGQDEAVATLIESVPQRNRKRHAVDELSELGQLHEGGKRQRSDVASSFAVPTLSLIPPLSPSRDTIVELTADGSVPTSQPEAMCRANGEQGGDLLGSGCCCGACVRQWAKKLMNRMQQLEEEVAKLRRHVSSCHSCDVAVASTSTCNVQGPTSTTRHSSDQGATAQPVRFAKKPCSSALTAPTTASATKNDAMETTGVESQKAHGREANNTAPPAMVQRDEGTLSADGEVGGEITSSAEGSQLPTEQRRSKAPRPAPTEDLVKMRLVNDYNRLNEQILVNERAVKDSIELAESMMTTDKTTGMELRSQIEELRVSIGREKEKRDIALAALISYDWGARRKEEELELLVNSATRSDMPGAQQTFHEKCAFLASELKRNGMELLALRYEAHPPEIKAAADAQRLAKKLDDVQATRARLENELQEVYMCLLRSSRRIRSLVKIRSKHHETTRSLS